MEAAETEAETAALEALAKVADILEPIGLQEETELPAQILAEFVMDSRKKDKLLCSQLQVVDFLQNFLVQKNTAQGLDPLASEDTSRQKAIEAKERWKELKATYQEHVEAITSALTQALPKVEEVRRKQAQLQEALQQLQAKKQMTMEKLRIAQKKWQLQQEKCLQHLAEVSAEVREHQKGTKQELDRLYQELGTLKQQAGQEQDKLQRLTAHSLLEVRACHGFLGNNNMGKDLRTDQTPAQTVVSLDCSHRDLSSEIQLLLERNGPLHP
ncbi:outer kinetochore KNL1 complex subunit ZWINT isoform X3 [Vicugna pacos]|uniref:Outer kinetochore KNL1 complex subunit ZWINT isoform X3 n=1 Tax=Vicugna pacos TaxID=30538 RepID=A0ABM5E385_VICPA